MNLIFATILKNWLCYKSIRLQVLFFTDESTCTFPAKLLTGRDRTRLNTHATCTVLRTVSCCGPACIVFCFVLLFCLHLLFSFSCFTDVHTWFHSSNPHTGSRSPINHSPLKSPLFVSRGWLFVGWAVAELWLFCWFIDLSLVLTHLLSCVIWVVSSLVGPCVAFCK